MQLHPKVIEQYAASRSHTYKGIVCHAPFVSLNFEQNGNVRACCYNTKDILGTWPQQSLREIWWGKKARMLREHIRNNDLGGGCSECGNMIIAGNHHGVRARYFDEYAPNGLGTRLHYFRNQLTGYVHYPRVLEFELSNECNLECVMCNGYFSSSIRKNREKLPPIVSPYNDRFVDELDEFIPHITDAKFLGGEPFMIEIYLKIWERILKIKPSVRIHITTNGTFLNHRIKDLLEGLKAGIIVSIDAVKEETYNKIRINGNFKKVMENLSYLLDYTQRKRTFISMAACPIIYNWKELPEMLSFCLERNIALYFNAVFTPEELSLREQPIELLQEIISYLESNPAPEKQGNPLSPRNLSIEAYNDFIKLLKGWLRERKTILKEKSERLQQVKIEEIATDIKYEQVTWNADVFLKLLHQLTDISGKGYFEEEKKLQSRLASMLLSCNADDLNEVFTAYLLFYIRFSKLKNAMPDAEKVKFLSELIASHPQRNAVLVQISKVPPVQLGGLFFNRELADLQNDLKTFFG
jgi:MoaA/NifB/PqqE/SkfB family radical SAM enzyme